MSVSYTHLDVYKRQSQDSAMETFINLKQAKKCKGFNCPGKRV